MISETNRLLNEYVQIEYSLHCLSRCLEILEQDGEEGQKAIRLSREILNINIKKLKYTTAQMEQELFALEQKQAENP